MNYQERQKHGSTAYQMFSKWAVHEERYFKGIYQVGVEFDRKSVKNKLSKYCDFTSLIIRHRPDAIAFTDDRSVLLQIKGRSAKELNSFSIEVDSWRATYEWNMSYENAAMIFVDILNKKFFACWPESIYPETIRLPERFDSKINYERLRSIYPNSKIITEKQTNGSGTPYFWTYIHELEDFDDWWWSFISLTSQTKAPNEVIVR